VKGGKFSARPPGGPWGREKMCWKPLAYCFDLFYIKYYCPAVPGRGIPRQKLGEKGLRRSSGVESRDVGFLKFSKYERRTR